MSVEMKGSILIVITMFLVADGFSTDICNHDNLSGETKKATACYETALLKVINEIVDDYIFQLDTNDFFGYSIYDIGKGCEPLHRSWNDFKYCSMNLATSCFDYQVADLIEQIFDDNPCNTLISLQGRNLIRKLTKHVNIKRNLDIMIIDSLKFDKVCSLEKRINEFSETFETIMDIVKKSEKYILRSSKYSNESNFRFTRQWGLCAIFDAVEISMVENDCFSSQEMDLIKHLLMAYYRLSWRPFVIIREKFGGIQEILNSLAKTKVKIGNKVYSEPQTTIEQMSSDMKSTIIKIANEALDDFESRECQERINSGSKIEISYSLLFIIWHFIDGFN